MSKNNIKFIAADMDGTLLNQEGQLDPEFYPLFEQLEQRDIIFAAASGRQYYSLAETFKPIKDRMVFIAENGSLVMHQDKELYSCVIDKSLVHSVIKEARSIDGVSIVLCGKESAYVESDSEIVANEIKKYYNRCQYVGDLLDVEGEFIKIALCHFDGIEEYAYPQLNAKFSEQCQVVVSGKVWLDVMNIKASKGEAIAHLQQTMGFTFEQTMSFGDYFNDIEMLQASFHSYAMENAHEKVKPFARFNAPSNREAGVLKVIKEYLA